MKSIVMQLLDNLLS